MLSVTVGRPKNLGSIPATLSVTAGDPKNLGSIPATLSVTAGDPKNLGSIPAMLSVTAGDPKNLGFIPVRRKKFIQKFHTCVEALPAQTACALLSAGKEAGLM
jgi:hypothetical protein